MDWYPWSPRRHKSMTWHLCPYADGLYRRLQDEYMDTEHALPDSDVALARICGVTVYEFAPFSATVRRFFTARNGMLHHEDCDDELRVRAQKKKKRSTKAEKAAKTMHEKRKQNQLCKQVEHKPSTLQAEPEHAMSMLTPATGQDRTEERKDGGLAFKGKVIRLNMADYDSWLKMSGRRADDFFQYLDRRDEWLSQQGLHIQRNWFVSTARQIQGDANGTQH